MGCAIIRRAIHDAVIKSNIPIEVKEKDVSEVKKSFLKANGIKDFPTVLFYKNDKLVLRQKGSKPEPVITRWIDIHFR